MNTIKSSNEISILFKKGIRVYSNGIIIIFSPKKINKNSNRIAFIAGKKNGNAVWRNKAKRRMRVIYNELSFLFNDRDVIFLARKNINNINYKFLKDSIVNSLKVNNNRNMNEKPYKSI